MIIPSSSTNASDDNPINNSYNFQNNELNKSESELQLASIETLSIARRVVQTLGQKSIFSLYLDRTLNQLYDTAKWVAPEVAFLESKTDSALAFIELYEELLDDLRDYDLDVYCNYLQKLINNSTNESIEPNEYIIYGQRLFNIRETIEAMLALDCYYNLLDSNQIQRMYSDFAEFVNIFNSALKKNDLPNSSTSFEKYRSNRSITYSVGTTVYTTSRNPVTTWYASEELSPTDIAIARSTFENKPGYYDITYISTATSFYNCHAYAWYSTNPGRKWIDLNYPSSNPVYYGVEQYISDDHCTSLGSSDSVAQVNDIIVYWVNGLPAHSGIVVSTNPLRIESKWGPGCVWVHNKSSVPDSYKESGVVNATYYRYSRSHNYQYSQVSSTKHRALCTVCGHTFLESHYYWNNNNICSLCGYISNRLRNQDEEDCDSCTHSN